MKIRHTMSPYKVYGLAYKYNNNNIKKIDLSMAVVIDTLVL
jgi:hypothetical protein